MKRILFSLMCIFVLQTSIFAQDTKSIDAIREVLDDDKLSQISSADEKIASGNETLTKLQESQTKINNLRQSAMKLKKSKQKAALKQVETKQLALDTKKNSALDLIRSGYDTKFNVYKADISERANDVPGHKKTLIYDMIDESDDFWDKAQAEFKKVPSGKNADMSAIVKAKTEGTNYQSKAIGVQEDTYVKILGLYDKVEQVEQVEEEKPAAQEAPKVEAPKNRIFFKVQIAASLVPLTIECLNEIYNTDDIINNELIEGTYRYLVGHYKTKEEAMAARDKMGVKGAFVVKYLNGKRLMDITDDESGSN